MVNSVGNAGSSPNNLSGIGIYCNNVDISKLSKEERDQYLEKMPNCTVVGPGYGQAYPGGYYINNYAQNTVKKRVTILTDAYIKQLDEYLQNPNKELREYAASEVVKRLSEDRTRHDNKQLNVLVNRMLLDPYDKKVRGRALMILENQLAKGNEDTKQILDWIQQDPNALERHKVQIEKIKLQLCADTTMVNAPVVNNGGGITE